MSLTSKVFLDKRHTKKDGTHAIKIRITLNRKSFEIASGYIFPAKYWDDKKQRIKPRCPKIQNVTLLNNRIAQMEINIIDKIIDLQKSGEANHMTISDVKTHITGKKKKTTDVIAFFNVIITELELAGKVGYARVYKMVRNSIFNFLAKRDVPLKSITYEWLKDYELWYLGRGNKINGLSINLKTFRTLMNNAIKRGLIPQESYPFKNYSIKKEMTRKRAIRQEDIQAIIDYAPQTPRQEMAKDYFLISFYLMGASFVDLAFLTMNDIKNGRIEYKRKKTGRLHSIKITPTLLTILNKHTGKKQSDDFMLDIIKRKVSKALYMDIHVRDKSIYYTLRSNNKTLSITLTQELLQHINQYPLGKKRQDCLINIVIQEETKQQYKDIHNALKLYNNTMDEISSACGITSKITSYVARHSFATIAKYKGVPIPVISQALGHADLKTTEIYLAQFDNDTMDKYNDLITGG